MKRGPIRGLTIGLFVALMSFGNYTRLTGGDCIRAIHIVTLVVCGMGLGVALLSFLLLIQGKKITDK